MCVYTILDTSSLLTMAAHLGHASTKNIYIVFPSRQKSFTWFPQLKKYLCFPKQKKIFTLFPQVKIYLFWFSQEIKVYNFVSATETISAFVFPSKRKYCFVFPSK